MKNTIQLLTVTLFAAALAGCGAARLPQLVDDGDAERARRILDRAVEAHGGAERWQAIDSIVVRYEGEWASVGPRLQPVLADRKYRRGSTEVILPAERIVGQLHEGPAGLKQVYREPGLVEVSYDGAPVERDNVLDAAALVADSYQMFLTTPFFFKEFAQAPVLAGSETVDGEVCDRVAARFQPGFGRIDEDLAVISVGRDSGLVRRVRYSINGTQPTRGAEVDVTFKEHREIDGIVWATSYVERIRAPVKLAAHRWRLISLETNRDVDPRRPGAIQPGDPTETNAHASKP